MNLPILNLHQTLSIAIIVQPNSPKLAKQTEQSISYLSGVFVIFVIIGFIIGCFLKYRLDKKLRHQRTLEIIQEINKLDNLPNMTTEMESSITSQRRKQIEALEKSWKKIS